MLSAKGEKKNPFDILRENLSLDLVPRLFEERAFVGKENIQCWHSQLMHRPRKVCRKVQQFSIFLVLFGIPLPLLVDTKRKTKPKINCFKYSSTIYYEFLGSLSSGQGDLEK